ncbi:MAG: hypothetical protein PHX03_04985 [Bacilli bacterium]|nr:hypothetical protein [Bacilli bacterium]MDD4718822.1 hypothetical protein [Bacilli bacterium]
MKKYIVPIIIITFLTVGCGKLTIHDKLINNKYTEVETNNYIKNINNTEYFYFDLSKDSKYFIYAVEDKYHIYFFNQETAIIEECDYDLKNKLSQNNSTCTDAQIEIANKLKQTFEEQIKIMNITISDLQQFEG